MQSLTVKDYYKANTSVWWDTHSCYVPQGYNACRIIDTIKLALQHQRYQGKIAIHVYGSYGFFRVEDEEVLRKKDVCFSPIVGKETINKNIISDMSSWSGLNKKPANILLLSDDPDFSDLVHQLRHRKYNILLALPDMLKSPSLVLAASTIWPWSKLLRGGSPDVVKPITCLPGFQNEEKEEEKARGGPKLKWKKKEKGETSGT